MTFLYKENALLKFSRSRISLICILKPNLKVGWIFYQLMQSLNHRPLSTNKFFTFNSLIFLKAIYDIVLPIYCS